MTETDIKTRLLWITPHAPTFVAATTREAADHITRLEERCAAYKGQVEAGAAEIERVTKERDEAREALYIIANIGATATAFTLSRNLRLAEDTARAALNLKDPS